MAYLTQPDYVKYICSCGQLKPITSLYFCRHCLKIRCGFCICHEVDSHYCANCLENMPSSEARLKKNRCSSCFDCPSCFHTLSTRATMAQPRQVLTDQAAGGDAKVESKQPKKMYYLSCFNCRWTSRDVGIPDQPVASGGWPERTNPYAARVNQLLDYYKAIAMQEKQEKIERERKKFNIRGKYITLTTSEWTDSKMSESPNSRASSAPDLSDLSMDDSAEDFRINVNRRTCKRGHNDEFTQAFEDFTRRIMTTLNDWKMDFGQDISQINTTLKNLNESTQEMKSEVISIRNELTELKKTVRRLESRQTEAKGSPSASVTSLKKSMQHHSDDYDDVAKKLEIQTKEIKDLYQLKKELDEVKVQNRKLRTDVNASEQRDRLLNIEIVGIPELVNENLNEIILKIGKHTEIDRKCSYEDKTGLTGAMARNIAGLPSSESSSSAIASFVPSQATEEVDELPDDIFTKEVNLNQITSMPQRLASPEWQPVSVSRLHPLAKLLSVKRSQRCRACDHNLTKPEYNPGSIKFKIELLAYYHVPEVKIISHEPVKPGAKSALLLKLTNPTGHEMQLRLLRPEDIPPQEDKEEPKSIDKSLERSLNLDKDTSSFKAIERVPVYKATSEVTCPDVTLTLAQRDDAAEYDDDAQHDTNDIIMWRKSNKLALRLEVVTDEAAEGGAPAVARVALQYSYRNTVPPAAAAAQPRDHTLYTTVLLDLGNVSSN